MTRTTSNKRKFFSEEQQIFLVSLLIAFLFWVATQFSESYTHEYSFQMDYELPDSMTFRTQPVEQLRATVTGEGWSLFRMSAKKDFKRLKFDITGEREQNLSRPEIIGTISDHFRDPSILIDRLSQDAINVQLDKKISKKIPIVWNQKVEIEKGFSQTNPVRFQPDSITFTGPEQMLRSVSSWTIRNPNLSVLNENLNMQVLPVEPNIKWLEMEPKVINLLIDIEPITEFSFYVTVLPNQIDTAEFNIFPNQVLVNGQTGLSKFEQVKPDMFKIQVKATDNYAALDAIPVELIVIPEFVSNVQFRPKSVQLLIQQDSTQSN